MLDLILPDNAVFKSELRPDLLNGIEILKGKSIASIKRAEGETVFDKEQDFIAIPYYAWAPRGTGKMAVWLPGKPEKIRCPYLTKIQVCPSRYFSITSIL